MFCLKVIFTNHHGFVDGLDLEIAHHGRNGVVGSLRLISRDSPLSSASLHVVSSVMSRRHVLKIIFMKKKNTFILSKSRPLTQESLIKSKAAGMDITWPYRFKIDFTVPPA